MTTSPFEPLTVCGMPVIRRFPRHLPRKNAKNSIEPELLILCGSGNWISAEALADISIARAREEAPSAHFVIGRSGRVFHCLPTDLAFSVGAVHLPAPSDGGGEVVKVEKKHAKGGAYRGVVIQFANRGEMPPKEFERMGSGRFPAASRRIGVSLGRGIEYLTGAQVHAAGDLAKQLREELPTITAAADGECVRGKRHGPMLPGIHPALAHAGFKGLPLFTWAGEGWRGTAEGSAA